MLTLHILTIKCILQFSLDEKITTITLNTFKPYSSKMKLRSSFNLLKKMKSNFNFDNENLSSEGNHDLLENVFSDC